MSDSAFPVVRRGIKMKVVGKVETPTSGNYNSLANLPITNVVGVSSDNYVSVQGLEAGHYRLSGYYKLGSDNKTKRASYPLDLTVFESEDTDELGNITYYKTVMYMNAEDGGIYLYKFSFENGTLVDESRSSMEGPEWEVLG